MKKTIMNTTPVLLITYNRPFHTQKVLNALKKHNVQNLYIFSDGFKSDKDLASLYETRLLFQSQRKNFLKSKETFHLVF